MAVEIRGLNRLINKFERIAAGLEDETQKAMEHELRGPLPPYPPTRPGQKYQRTFELQHSLKSYVRPLPSEVQGVLEAAAPHAPWVIDKERQAWMHVGRWWTLQDEAIKLLPRVLAGIARGIRGLLS